QARTRCGTGAYQGVSGRWLGQRLQLDLTKIQLQRVARDVKEIIGSVRESDVQLSTLGCRRPQRSLIQYFLYCGRAILCRIDERDFTSERARNSGAEQRIMGAAKHERVDFVCK